MNAVILSIGTELTTGQNLDTNSAWLSAELTRMGVTVIRHVTVDDDLGRITQAVRLALDEAEAGIATGGLGPTADDLTRQALADAIGRPLEENPEAFAQIRDFFERWRRPMHEANFLQAQLPRECTVIHNQWGTAPGIHFRDERSEFFALPGVPNEMKNMFRVSVAPIIAARSGEARMLSATLRCFGMTEAQIGSSLINLMRRDRNPLVGTLASRGIITVSILAQGSTMGEANRLLETDRAEVRRRLGDAVFGEGDDTLESVVGRRLRELGLTLAVAESCTGGLLAKRITDVPGCSDYFIRGYVAYADSAKSELLGVSPALIATHGAVSEEVVRALAAGCRASAQSDYVLALTGIAGPGGGTAEKPVGLVWFALADEKGIETLRVLFGEHLCREDVRDRACSTALNLLRHRLLCKELDSR